MTLYMVQRCLFDHLRRLEAAGDGPKPDIVTEGYTLTPEERRAVTEPDVGAIYAIVVGFIAASVSGEMAESWAFVLLDAAATIVAFAAAAWVLKQAGWARQERKA